ncbi:hypothetical protein D3C71_1569790 [compost metagenome]
MATGEHQAIVGPQQEWLGHCPQCSEPGDEGLFQSAGGRSGSPCARQVPAQQLSRMAVDDQGQRRPAVSPSPDTAQVCRPALVGRLGHRWQSLDARPHANRPLAYLPAPDLEDALHGVLIEPQQMCHRPVAERGVLFDHCLNRLGKLRRHLGLGFDRLVVHGAAGHFEPATQLAQAGRHSITEQALLYAKDHFPSSSSKACSFFRARSSSIASP